MEDGDEAFDNYALDEDEDSDGLEYKELDFDKLTFEASEIDTAGITIAKEDRLKSDNVPERNEESGEFIIKDILRVAHNFMSLVFFLKEISCSYT